MERSKDPHSLEGSFEFHKGAVLKQSQREGIPKQRKTIKYFIRIRIYKYITFW